MKKILVGFALFLFATVSFAQMPYYPLDYNYIVNEANGPDGSGRSVALIFPTSNVNCLFNWTGAAIDITPSCVTPGVGLILNNSAISATPLAVGAANARMMALATAYQATDPTKPSVWTVTLSCPVTLAVAGTTSCTGEVRVGTAATIAGGTTGIIYAPILSSTTGLLGAGNNAYETKTITLASGEYIAVRQPTGTGLTVVTAIERSISNY